MRIQRELLLVVVHWRGHGCSLRRVQLLLGRELQKYLVLFQTGFRTY